VRVIQPARTADLIAAVRRTASDGALRLAYHAALPVVIDSGLLNLLRVNFFLDPPDALPYESEADLLLSPLFREVGSDLYEIDPQARNTLLIGLHSRYGAARVRQVALLLEQYTDSTPAWTGQPELEQAQRLTALSFVDPARAQAWLETVHTGGRAAALSRQWYVAMRQRLAAQPAGADMAAELSAAASRLADDSAKTRLTAIRSLALLAQLPDCDAAALTAMLAGMIRAHAVSLHNPVGADVQEALALLGRLTSDVSPDLSRVKLIEADLHDLDLREANLAFAVLARCSAVRVNLAGAYLGAATLDAVNADGANLTGVDFRATKLFEVSLRNANLTRADLSGAVLGRVDFAGANLTDARLPAVGQDLVPRGDVDISVEHVDYSGREGSEDSLGTAGAPGSPLLPSVGDIRQGVVTGLSAEGALVDIGGVTGTVYTRDLTWRLIDDPGQAVQAGDHVTVKVTDVYADDDDGDHVVILSLRALQEDPWPAFATRHPVGSMLQGTVVRLAPFGAFMNVNEYIQGLVHLSEMANHRVEIPQQVVQLDDEVWAKILDLDLDRHRLSLSMKQAVPPDEFDPAMYGYPAEPADPARDTDESEALYAAALEAYARHRRAALEPESSASAADAPPVADPARGSTSVQAALDRYRRSGSDADLDAVIDQMRSDLDLKRLSRTKEAALLSNFGAMMRERFERHGNETDLSEAVYSGGKALEIAPRWDRNRTSYLSNFSSTMAISYRLRNDIADLTLAIELAEQALAGARSDSDRTSIESNLAAILKTRFEHSGDRADLDLSVAASERALSLAGADHPHFPLILSNLANALRARFEISGKQPDLDRAIDLGETAIGAAVRPDNLQATLHNSLGLALGLRSALRRDRSDIDRAVQAFTASVAATSPGSPAYSLYVSNLSAALLYRFGITHDPADLRAATGQARRAVDTAAAGNPARGRALVMLADSLRVRHDSTRRDEDRDDAIAYLREAAAISPDGDRNLAAILSGLGEALLERYQTRGDSVDLDDAIRAYSDAAEVAGPADPGRVSYLEQFSGALKVRYELSRDPTDLHRAAELRAPADPAAPRLQNWEIACVDNNPRSLNTLIAMLEANGAGVRVYPDAEPFIRTLQRGHPDAVVLHSRTGDDDSERFGRVQLFRRSGYTGPVVLFADRVTSEGQGMAAKLGALSIVSTETEVIDALQLARPPGPESAKPAR